MNIRVNEKYKTTIFSQENEGLGVSKIDNIIVFVENGLPGDKGEVLITEIKKNFGRGKMLSFESLSNGRQDAPCPYFNECGGCDLQHQKYAHQLVFKEYKVRTALERIGGFKGISINPIVFDDDFEYRNKVTLKVSRNKLGFYKRNTNDIVDINHCIISNKKINEIIHILQMFIKNYPDNDFESIMIRNVLGLMIYITSKSEKLAKEVVDYITTNTGYLTSLIFNDKIIYGSDSITGKIDDLTFTIRSKTFYQVNNNIMKKMYNKVLEYVMKANNDTILDLYCGVGTITLLLSKYAKRVIGIEAVEDSIIGAKENMKINNINNVIFINGKVEDEIVSLENEQINTIVVDPPRNGVDKKALDTIIKIYPKQIVYVSCNPVTLARDLKILNNAGYEIKDVTPFDMFPQTSHVETVVMMSVMIGKERSEKE